MKRIGFAVFAVLVVFAQALCADVIRIDPNTPEGQAALGLSEPERSDIRLVQNVTYVAEKKRVAKKSE